MENSNKTQPALKLNFYYGLLKVEASGTIAVCAAVAAYGSILICKCFGLL